MADMTLRQFARDTAREISLRKTGQHRLRQVGTTGSAMIRHSQEDWQNLDYPERDYKRLHTG